MAGESGLSVIADSTQDLPQWALWPSHDTLGPRMLNLPFCDLRHIGSPPMELTFQPHESRRLSQD